MDPASLDVPPELSEPLLARMRALGPTERALLLQSAWRGGRRLLESGIRAREPGLSEAGVRFRMTELMYGRAYAERVLGAEP